MFKKLVAPNVFPAMEAMFAVDVNLCQEVVKVFGSLAVDTAGLPPPDESKICVVETFKVLVASALAQNEIVIVCPAKVLTSSILWSTPQKSSAKTSFGF